MLKVHKVKKQFGNKVILDGISFSLNPGEIAIFLGDSGGGKTTLLRVLAGLEKVDSGEVSCDAKVGMVFQQLHLFPHLSALKNLTLPLEKIGKFTKKEAKQKAKALLAKFNLEEFASSRIASLSGGQKQRLALARTLAANPSVICLDEPTSALDPKLTARVANEISTLAKEGYSIAIATHDVAIIELLDCSLFLMEGGKIVARASSKDFLASPKKYPLLDSFISPSRMEKSHAPHLVSTTL